MVKCPKAKSDRWIVAVSLITDRIRSNISDDWTADCRTMVRSSPFLTAQKVTAIIK